MKITLLYNLTNFLFFFVFLLRDSFSLRLDLSQVGGITRKLTVQTTPSPDPRRDFNMFNYMPLRSTLETNGFDESENHDDFSTKRKKERLLDKGNSNCTYHETYNTVQYKIYTPRFPNYISYHDIELYVTTRLIQLRARGSGSYWNKYIKPITGYDSLRKIQYKSRDWEMWINLKHEIKPDCAVNSKIRRIGGNAFEIEVTYSRFCVNLYSDYDVIPFFFKNSTHRKITSDLYHLQIPKNPHYVLRTMLTPEKEYYEMLTVASDKSHHTKEMKESMKSTLLMEANTLNVIKDFNQTIANTTFVNLDQSFPKWKGTINTDYDGVKIKHDPVYYDVLKSVRPPMKITDSSLINHFAQQNKGMVKFDKHKNKVVLDNDDNEELHSHWLTRPLNSS